MQTTSPSSTVAPSAQPGWQQAGLAQAIHLRSQMNGSISWFFIIAGMTVVNSVLVRSEAQLTFVVGLAASQFVDGISIALAQEFDAVLSTVITVVGLAVNLALAGVFALAGWLARQQHRWAVVAGMVLYALDSLLLLVFADWLGLIFHGLALFGMIRAFTMMGQLRKLEAALAAGDAGAMQAMLTATSGAAVLPATAPTEVPRLYQPVGAAVTLPSFLSDPFNWFMVVPFGLLGLMAALALFITFNIAFVVIAVVLLGFAGYYTWAVLTRRIEVSDEGVRYWEGRRRHFFPWGEISAVKIEQPLKQITFWIGGKFRRIHEFGLPQEELKRVREVLVQQITARRIPVR